MNAQGAVVQFAPNEKWNFRLEWARSSYLYRIPGPLTDAMFATDPTQATRTRNYFSPTINVPSFRATYRLSANTTVEFTSSAVIGTRNSVMFDAFANIPDTINQLTGEYDAVPAVQRAYKAAGVPSIVVGDHNYGEGSSREHAAMEPRFLGVKAVLVKSFARIHETNLKKQGMLALTFANEVDYDKIQENDTINFVDLVDFAPGKPLTLEFVHADGSKDVIMANHSYNESQIGWFVAGSALNLIAAAGKA